MSLTGVPRNTSRTTQALRVLVDQQHADAIVQVREGRDALLNHGSVGGHRQRPPAEQQKSAKSDSIRRALMQAMYTR